MCNLMVRIRACASVVACRFTGLPPKRSQASLGRMAFSAFFFRIRFARSSTTLK